MVPPLIFVPLIVVAITFVPFTVVPFIVVAVTEVLWIDPFIPLSVIDGVPFPPSEVRNIC